MLLLASNFTIFNERDGQKRSIVKKRGNNCTVIIYTLAFWFTLAVGQPKYIDANIYDQNIGNFRNRGKHSILLWMGSCAIFLCSY